MELMSMDKKVVDGKIRLVLQKGIGDAVITSDYDTKHLKTTLQTIKFFSMMKLAPYAAHPEQSRGRRFKEETSALRNEFQRDRDRVIHSTAFQAT
jgi:hypothetical protein